MLNSKKTYKIIRRDSTQEESKDEVVLVRVKRSVGMRDDVEELQLEFDKTGDVKR